MRCNVHPGPRAPRRDWSQRTGMRQRQIAGLEAAAARTRATESVAGSPPPAVPTPAAVRTELAADTALRHSHDGASNLRGKSRS